MIAFKLNIADAIESEMTQIFSQIHIKSKTEYINNAIRYYNKMMLRTLELNKLKNYFADTREESKEVLREFAKIRTI